MLDVRPGLHHPQRVLLQEISSLDDSRVAVFRNVRDAQLRERAGLFVVEGRLGLRRLVAESEFRPRALLLTPVALEASSDLLGKLAADTPVYLAAPALLRAVVGYPMHRGCLALAERGAARRFESLLARARDGRGPLLVLEELSDPDNVGALFRNARAFGAEAVLMTRGCADPLSRKSIRVSMAATLQLPWATIPGVPELVPQLEASGYRVVALTPSPAAEALESVATRLGAGARVALVLGSEGEGLSAAALAAGARARIVMAPGMDSLNVATAAAIALHHFARGGDAPPG